MKTYPSIGRRIVDIDIYAFDKLDGSNIRAEWTRKSRSFTKFGSRNRLLGTDQGKIATASELINDKYAKIMTEELSRHKYERVICFFEMYGPNSFAGNHPDDISEMTVSLFDVST